MKTKAFMDEKKSRHGGKRPGAGRKKDGRPRKTVSFRLLEEDYKGLVEVCRREGVSQAVYVARRIRKDLA